MNTSPPFANRVLTTEPGATRLFEFLLETTGYSGPAGHPEIQRAPYDEDGFGFRRIEVLDDGRERWEIHINAGKRGFLARLQPTDIAKALPEPPIPVDVAC